LRAIPRNPRSFGGQTGNEAARPYGRSFRCALAAALKSGADVSVIVRLDAKVKTAISSIPEDACP
jgi:hypothetical protein